MVAMRTIIAGAALGAVSVTAGCVNVSAPDKPIEINLNIAVTQQVVVKLDGQARSLIEQNPGIF
jgi:hypothetical protein